MENDSFTYTFSKGEDRVYFAHHMLYHPNRFFSFGRSYSRAIFKYVEGENK